MTCPKDDSRLSAWIDGELPEPEALEMDGHVAGCARCGELVSSFERLRESLAVELEPDPGFLVRFRERRDELSIAPWWTWRQLALRLAPLAAAALLLAAVSVVLSSSGPDLDTLELEALGDSNAFGRSASVEEPVLSIALGPFPEEVP